MKISRIILALMVVLTLVGVSTQSALAYAFVYTSGFQVQNIDPSNNATVLIDFYEADGTQPSGSEISDTINAGTSKTYYPLTGLPSGFKGSVVISSDYQVASVVNILGSGSVSAAASYVASNGGNSTVLIPLAMHSNSGYNTWFSVQNTGNATTDISVTYSDGTTASATDVVAGAAAVFDQSTETHSAKVFSAVVTSPSSVPLAATVIEENSKTMFAYNGFSAGSTNVVMPLINANNSGYVTGVQIQNSGASATTVTLSYTPSSAGTACTETQTIQAGKSNTFALAAFAGTTVPNSGSTTCTKEKFIGSAQVTTNSASMPLEAIVNQLKSGVNGEAYDAFDPDAATTEVVLPLIMDRNGGFFTGISVMNVGTSATVTCNFSNTSYQLSQTVDSFSSLIDIENNKIANKYVGSATCTAGTGGKLVAIVNELSNASGDNLLVYEGIPVTP